MGMKLRRSLEGGLTVFGYLTLAPSTMPCVAWKRRDSSLLIFSIKKRD